MCGVEHYEAGIMGVYEDIVILGTISGRFRLWGRMGKVSGT